MEDYIFWNNISKEINLLKSGCISNQNTKIEMKGNSFSIKFYSKDKSLASYRNNMFSANKDEFFFYFIDNNTSEKIGYDFDSSLKEKIEIISIKRDFKKIDSIFIGKKKEERFFYIQDSKIFEEIHNLVNQLDHHKENNLKKTQNIFNKLNKNLAKINSLLIDNKNKMIKNNFVENYNEIVKSLQIEIDKEIRISFLDKEIIKLSQTKKNKKKISREIDIYVSELKTLKKKKKKNIWEAETDLKADLVNIYTHIKNNFYIEYSFIVQLSLDDISEKWEIVWIPYKEMVLANTNQQTLKEIGSSLESGEINTHSYTIINNIIKPSTMKPSDSNSLRIDSDHYLDQSQSIAFHESIKQDGIVVIQGPPGTGKTEVITELIRYFNKQNQRVLLSSQSNAAIYNVIDKLSGWSLSRDGKKMGKGPIICEWLYNIQTTLNTKQNDFRKEFHIEEINNNWISLFDKRMDNLYNFKDKLAIEYIKNSASLEKEKDIFGVKDSRQHTNVFCATSSTSETNKPYAKEILQGIDVVIFDEVSKSVVPEILRYSLNSKKLILVGDPKQLSPIFGVDFKDFSSTELYINSNEKDVLDFKFDRLKKKIESGVFYEIFNEANNHNRRFFLENNYRTAKNILDTTYNNFYLDDGGLKSMVKDSSLNEIEFSKSSRFFDGKTNLYFIDNKGSKQERNGTSWINIGEIKIIKKILEDLDNNIINKKDISISVIFFYSAQIREWKKEKEIIKKISSDFQTFRFDTVDSFQGSQADIVILSTVVADKNRSRNNKFLSDFRRVNVAMSRAKKLLYIIGDKESLESIVIKGNHDEIEPKQYYQEFISNIKKNKRSKYEVEVYKND